jgi:hypothetical protein
VRIAYQQKHTDDIAATNHANLASKIASRVWRRRIRKSRRGRISKRILFFLLLINVVNASHRCGMVPLVFGIAGFKIVIADFRRHPQSHSMLESAPRPDNGPGTKESHGRQSHRSKDGVMKDGIV